MDKINARQNNSATLLNWNKMLMTKVYFVFSHAGGELLVELTCRSNLVSV